MRVVVGLGNPGAVYVNNRHNLGFIVLDRFLGNVDWENKFDSKFLRRGDVIFCKPQTFMNLSGRSLLGIRGFYGLRNEDFLVVYDDIYLPAGKFKFSFGRSDGGHNGLKGIISSLGGTDFSRLRIGIGPREAIRDRIADFVMSDLSREELTLLDGIMEPLGTALDNFLSGDDPAKLMGKFN